LARSISPCPERLRISETVSINVAQARVRLKGEKWPFILSGLLLPSLGKVFEKAAAHSAHCRAAAVSLALEQFRLDHNGSLPESLHELAPASAGKIPTDPFDGMQIRYKRLAHGYLVYSVGPDGEDNEGAERKELSNARRLSDAAAPPYDITIKVER